MTFADRTRLIVVPVLIAAVLSGCAEKKREPSVASAGGKPTASAGATAPQAQDAAAQGRRFAQCMRENGVDMEDPGPDGMMRGLEVTKANEAKLTAASAKCREFLPNGGEPEKMSAEDVAKRREYAECLRENGVPEFPDPDPETGEFRIDKDKDDVFDKLDAAAPKCRQFGGGAGMPAIRVDG
ncbi:hypothetical protein KZ829_08395 [Actinoplanes hulinensis]|uniref:Secreted protein n=1 Tax=Actinoplanes hulinensis TaxID=1144547 RepID=A0ABS7AYJ6_9ACTN|nr:hypothetical protein [Actinoplanes hulinensis]MBW6433762.1 hypothetical protein [Actinoplanes hulinensis]